MGTWMGLCSGNPGLGAGDSRVLTPAPTPAMDTWVRSGSLAMPLSAKEQPRLWPFPPLLARGAISQHTPVPTLGRKWTQNGNPCFPRLVTPNLACQTLSRSAILLIWECLGEMPGSPDLLPISVPSLDTEGPLMLLRLPVPGALTVL